MGQPDEELKRVRCFLDAFARIEQHFRATLRKTPNISFGTLLDEYATKCALHPDHRTALATFAFLRNAISHDEYLNGRPIAVPRADAVAAIEALADQVLHPRQALDVIGSQDVKTLDASGPVTDFLDLVNVHGFSQAPVVRADGHYTFLLTVNTVTRWMADCMQRGQPVDYATPIAKLKTHIETGTELVLPRPASLTAAEAVRLLSAEHGRPCRAVLLTDTGGLSTEIIRGILVVDDLAALVGALRYR